MVPVDGHVADVVAVLPEARPRRRLPEDGVAMNAAYLEVISIS